jgi:predicted RNase H-like nuclease (RuvC/YqgF family)
MTPIPNVTKFSSPTEKPNNNNSINSQQDNYDKLYNDEKLKIEDLEKKITKLQNVNEYLEKELKIEREKNYNISNKENTSNEDLNKIIKLYDEISENQKEIKNLKGKLERFPFELCENEKIMSVIISTEDKTILYSVIAKNTDKFLRVEEKFYDAFPEFGKVENSFYINENKINKYQTLEENAIKNSELIIIKKEINSLSIISFIKPMPICNF